MSKQSPPEDQDQALFQTAMRDVKPLKAKKPKISMQAVQRPSIPKRPSEQSWQLQSTTYLSTKTQRNLPLSGFKPDFSHEMTSPVLAETQLAYHQPGLSRQQVNALKTGKLTYQAKLDLHGLTPDAAEEQFHHFLSHQIQQQQRWVLIVHGKGGRYGEAPVLKNLVHQWLLKATSVLGFHSAQPKHGGNGATYVLLKPKTRG